MKKLLAIMILPLVMGADDCASTDGRQRAANHLGNGAICTWASDDNNNHEIICIAKGQRFVCLTSGRDVSCAVTSAPPSAEAR